jgi:hypothetical protein
MVLNRPVQLSSTKKPAALSTLRRLAASRLAPWGHTLRWADPFGRPAAYGYPEQFTQRGTCSGCGGTILIAQLVSGGSCSDNMAGELCTKYIK